MNHFIEYVCRGVIRSEDAIRSMNGKLLRLAKCNNQLSASVICICVAGIAMTAIVSSQDSEIKALKRKVAGLSKQMEELKNKKGA